MFESRSANSRWGHALGFLLFTPYRWWQRQHSLHHAHTGNLDKRGPGEIYTMTLAEYEGASRLRRLGYRFYRNPLLMLLVGPSLVFLFERRFPQRGMSRRILLSVVADEPRARRVGDRLERACRLGDLPAHPGDDARRRRRDRRLDALHPAPVRGHLLPVLGRVAVRARRAAGQLVPRAPAPARLDRRQRQLPPRAPPEREDPELPPARGARGAADVRAHPRGDHPRQPRRPAPQALGRGERPPRPPPQISGGAVASRRAPAAARGRRRPPSPSAAGRSSTARRPAGRHRASTSRRHPSGRSPAAARSRRR